MLKYLEKCGESEYKMSNLFEISPWHLMSGKWDLQKKDQYQQALTLENSVMVVDGSFEEEPAKVKLQNIWIPQKSTTPCGYTGIQPGFLDLKKMIILLNNEPIDWQKDQISDFMIDLDLHNGLLTRSYVVSRDKLKVRLKFERFLSQAMPDLLVDRVTMSNLATQPIEVEIHASIDPYFNEETQNNDWEIIPPKLQTAALILITKPNPFNSQRFIAGAQAHHLTSLRSVANPNLTNLKVEDWYRGNLLPDQPVIFEKRVVVATSLDYASDQAISERLEKRSNEIDNLTYEELLAANDLAWQKKYQNTDIVINGNAALQQTLRLANFHFLAAPDVQLPLRWENEALFVPALLEAGLTKTAKFYLKERFKQLAAMQANAKTTGVYGALLPELTFDGNEQAENADLTLFGVHRSFALVFAIAQYLAFSGDKKWLQEEGKTILLAIASYWHSRVQYSEYYQKYVVLGVSGPDAYENNSDNNWLTNYSIKEGINYLLKTIPQELDPDLKQALTKISQEIYLPQAEISGQKIKLENDHFLEKDLNYTAERLTIFDRPVFQNWSLDHLARAAIIQQPDVFWAFYYFPQNFSHDEIAANFNFYQKYLAHDTPLSLSLTALTAALAQQPDLATQFLKSEMNHYLINERNQAALIRLVITRGLLGLSFNDNGLVLEPKIAEDISSYQLRIFYLNHLLEISVDPTEIKFKLLSNSPIQLTIFNQNLTLTPQKILPVSWPKKQN